MNSSYKIYASQNYVAEQVNVAVETLKSDGYIYEPTDKDIPKVFIDGIIPTTKDDVNAEITYISNTFNFHAYALIKCQGTSSMKYPKKNKS